MSSIYIHFPYCLYKCHYCDFNSYATDPSEIPFDAYLETLLEELKLRTRLFEESGWGSLVPGTRIETLFIGGGTPSLMPASHIERLIQGVQGHFKLEASSCEITMEANPGTLTRESIRDFIRAGINRISVGVQSLNEAYLSKFGRIHSANQARQVLGWLSESPLKSWNMDLIFGFPGETAEEWRTTLEEALGFQSPHLSCYAFMVEEEAPYGRWVKEGRAKSPDEELQGDLIAWTRRRVKDAGYQAYEISNFAKSGHECRHNLTYWRYQDYLGLGAGAVSLFSSHLKSRTDADGFVFRTANVKNPGRYIQSVQKGADFFEKETISKNLAVREWFMMNLRLAAGAPEADFERAFGGPFSPLHRRAFETLRAKGWMPPDGFQLTEEGILLANQAVAAFFFE